MGRLQREFSRENMATFFGEVLPSFSRAVDEDDDEDDSPSAKISCEWSWLKEKESCLKCSQLLMATDDMTEAFLRVYVLNSDHAEVAKLRILTSSCNLDVEIEKPRRAEEKSCVIYQLTGCDICVATLPSNLMPEHTYEITKELLSHISQHSLHITVLSSSAATTYKTERYDIQTPFLRCLKTSYCKSDAVSPYLEQPNTVEGIPAQVLTQCEIQGISACLYTCYKETMFLDADSLHVIQNALKKTDLSSVLKENPNAKEEIRKLLENNARSNQLYL